MALSGRGRLRARRRRRTRRSRPWSIPSTPRILDSRWSTRRSRRIARTRRLRHGDIAAALGAADRVVAVRFHQGRQTHVPLEPRGCLASWLPGDETLTFWHSTQIPHPMRSALAARLGISESAVRVITPDVGGGFGQKIPLYREELATAAASRLLGRRCAGSRPPREPARVASRPRGHRRRPGRGEVGRHHPGSGRADPHRLRRMRTSPANYMARVVGMMVPGAYRLRDYRYAITAVLTNKCPAGPYRAPMLICSWVTEGTIDAWLAPSSWIRSRSVAGTCSTESDLPYTTATELIYRSVYPRDTLERALKAFDYEAGGASERARGRAHRRDRRGHLRRAEHVRLGVLQDGRHPGLGARPRRVVRIEPSGAVAARSASSARGRAPDDGRPGAGRRADPADREDPRQVRRHGRRALRHGHPRQLEAAW